ncbi:hypothetical protein CPB86DRAFT_777708 [Serendipita vermifera]|nr:hypothetical protein CPB86DRAFT_777708 [Serendipita vermifera]
MDEDGICSDWRSDGLSDVWRIVVCAVTAFLFNIIPIGNRRLHVSPLSFIGMVAAILTLVFVVLDVLAVDGTPKDKEDPNGKGNNKEVKQDKKRVVRKRRLVLSAQAYTTLRQMIVFLAFVPVIVSLVMFTLQAINTHGKCRASLVTVDCMALVADILLCAAMTRGLMIATILMAINWQPYIGCILRPTTKAIATFALHQHEVNRINKLFTRFIIFYTILPCFTMFVLFFILRLAIHLFDKSLKALVTSTTLTCDPTLRGCTFVLFMVNFWATNFLQELPPSSLAFSQVQRDAFAKLINKYGKRVPDAPSGESAISLMQAYAQANIPGMKCIVLRVYKPSKVPEKSALLNSMTANYTYEDDWVWRNLDMEHMAIRHRSSLLPDLNTPVTSVPLQAPPPPKLSKEQQKKIAKAKAEAAANGGPTLPLSPITSPEELQAELEFAQKLESTEALVMMTQILDYDLSKTVKGLGGRILRRTLGAGSFFKPLCATLGLLAFHWPFRSATFYTSSTKRPIARSAAVLRAIAEWNEQRPRKERCAVLLDPTYQHGDGERAIAPSGWTATPLPPSHVVDLRAYKNKTVAEYLKAIKYRDQEGNFKKANGEVVESTDFTDDQCAVVMHLWHQIAEKRTGEGETAVLATPDESMLMQLSGGGKVLFRLGDTITSDLQGLDYELARPLKAYFVMMQHTIGIALREGKSFVDFGPTTPKLKLDIGCTSVGITGAMYVVNPLLRAATRIAANKVTEGMQAKE